MKQASEFHPPSDIWLLATEVSVVEAALLLVMVEPQGIAEDIEEWPEDRQPFNYRAARQVVLSAVINGEVSGMLIVPPGYPIEPADFLTYEGVDACASHVGLMSLRKWLDASDFRNEFLSLGPARSFATDKNHPRHSLKLAAALEAWENFSDVQNSPGTIKQRIEKWLRLNAARFELVDDDGNPQETVVQSIAKIVNWNTSGGAPKAEDRQSGKD